MPDITQCADDECPRHKNCYRYMATPDEFQSFFGERVMNEDGSCDYYWSLAEQNGEVELPHANSKD